MQHFVAFGISIAWGLIPVSLNDIFLFLSFVLALLPTPPPPTLLWGEGVLELKITSTGNEKNNFPQLTDS